jgi:Rieske Fe-S protein
MGVEKVENAPFSKTFHSGECLRFQNQAQFHIIKYLQGLTKAILKHGGKIFGESHVSHVEDGSPCLVKTEGGTIYAQSVIMATCSPVNNRFLIHTKQAGYRTYVIAASIPKGEIKKALYWDTEDPYHYIRTLERDAESEWVIVGGEDHKTGQGISSDRLYEHLEKWARERFHKMGKIQYRWSGQVFEPIDSLSFIGKNPGDKNIYVVTGDSGNGLTHGTIAGILIPALLSHKTHPWEKLYDPSRISFLATGDFVAENVNTALQYKDWFTPGEKKKVEALPTDKGIVLRKGLKKIAVYKDENNEVHVHSAFCPHLGGCVRWNDGEKRWDCPCHASRFDAKGNVITGPALCGLKKCAKC